MWQCDENYKALKQEKETKIALFDLVFGTSFLQGISIILHSYHFPCVCVCVISWFPFLVYGKNT